MKAVLCTYITVKDFVNVCMYILYFYFPLVNKERVISFAVVNPKIIGLHLQHVSTMSALHWTLTIKLEQK